MDRNPSGSSVCGIFQARILERSPCPPPGDLPNPGIKPPSQSPALPGRFFTASALWKAHLVHSLSLSLLFFSVASLKQASQVAQW